MIPKKIHFCWLSNDPYPPKIQKCIDSWKEKLPDYEIIKWDLNRFPLDKCIWVKEAFECKKYAFAADYIRFYALYTEGGIYLDSDVEVLKPFDKLLDLPYFLGKENVTSYIEAAVMGSEPSLDWLKDCLNYYQKKHFIGSPEQLQSKPLPFTMHDILSNKHGIVSISSSQDFRLEESKFQLLPEHFFSPKDFVTLEIHTSEDTFCIHHFTSAWRSKKDMFLFRVEGLFGKKIRILFWLILRNPLLNVKAVLRLLKERKKWW